MEILDRKILNIRTPTCHASTIAIHQNEPVFAWFGGTREGLPDSSIYVQYRNKVMSFGNKVSIAYWNPILFTIEDELFIAYKRGEFCDRWQTYILNITGIENKDSIKEDGAQIIPAGLNFCVKTKPLMDSLPYLYCGSSVETREDWTSYIEVYDYQGGNFIFDSRSKPLTVEKEKYIIEHPIYGRMPQKSRGIIQPSLWVDNKHNYHAFFRSSRGLGKIYHSVKESSSWGDGEWTDPLPTKFDNPNSGIDTVYINDRLFLVHNPSKTMRLPIVISELNDDFEVLDEMTVREEVDEGDLTNELSYPYMIENNGKIELVFTVGRSKIEYVSIQI